MHTTPRRTDAAAIAIFFASIDIRGLVRLAVRRPRIGELFVEKRGLQARAVATARSDECARATSATPLRQRVSQGREHVRDVGGDEVFRSSLGDGRLESSRAEDWAAVYIKDDCDLRGREESPQIAESASTRTQRQP